MSGVGSGVLPETPGHSRSETCRQMIVLYKIVASSLPRSLHLTPHTSHLTPHTSQVRVQSQQGDLPWLNVSAVLQFSQSFSLKHFGIKLLSRGHQISHSAGAANIDSIRKTFSKLITEWSCMFYPYRFYRNLIAVNRITLPRICISRSFTGQQI